VSRVVREAEALGLSPENDPLLAALSEQQAQARVWVEASKQLLDTLKALAQNQRRTDEEEVVLVVRRAQTHMEAARRLSLKVRERGGGLLGGPQLTGTVVVVFDSFVDCWDAVWELHGISSKLSPLQRTK
jgi:hypothetical protein